MASSPPDPASRTLGTLSVVVGGPIDPAEALVHVRSDHPSALDLFTHLCLVNRDSTDFSDPSLSPEGLDRALNRWFKIGLAAHITSRLMSEMPGAPRETAASFLEIERNISPVPPEPVQYEYESVLELTPGGFEATQLKPPGGTPAVSLTYQHLVFLALCYHTVDRVIREYGTGDDCYRRIARCFELLCPTQYVEEDFFYTDPEERVRAVIRRARGEE